MTVALDQRDRARLAGEEGPALALAMKLVVRAAEIMAAPRLIEISFAHLDACFYAGEAHVDFARFLHQHSARFAVTTWTNNGLVSLAQPDLRPEIADPERVCGARALMTLYAGLGAKPTWTCAPYQLPGGPRFGDHIAVGESNAVAYYNSVLGARTNKYGDYLDAACALIGKAPEAGLHTDGGRRAGLRFRLSGIGQDWLAEDVFYHLIGHHAGRISGRRIPLIEGLAPEASADNLKALSSAVAASGGVELWHGAGVTPEAMAPDAMWGGGPEYEVTPADLRAARDVLSSGRDGPLDMVALGTPHFSAREFQSLLSLLDGRKVKPGLPVLVSTSRFVRAAAGAEIAALEALGVSVVTDVCTYYSPAVRGARGRVMTNAAKWAYYAPGMLGVEVCFGALRECVESAVRGEVWRDAKLWRGIGA